MLLLSDNVADEVSVTQRHAHGSRRLGRAGSHARVLALALALTCAAAGCRYSVDLEPLKAAAQSSTITAADGTVLASLDTGEHRTDVKYADIAPVLRAAVISIEDHRYFEHPGVDVHAVVRALQHDATSGGIAEGGSTITQQYVRAVLLGRERTVHRKLREAVLAVQLERKYTKREILERYLNTIYFGNGAYGVQAAANRFFGTSASRLTLPQAALLAAVIRAPENYNPYTHKRAARLRRNLVLDKMAQYGHLTKQAAARAKSAPLGVSDRSWKHPSLAPYFVDQVKQFVLDHREFGATVAERRRALYAGGLKIQTALDPRLQALAEDAVAKVLVDPAHDPSAALVSIDPRTGHVKAYVGGRDYFGRDPWAKFDLASQSRRQAGSAFKPFVLATALEQGVPADTKYQAPAEITLPLRGQAPWVVHNYDGQGGGTMSLVDATVRSVNTVYAQLIMDVGPTPVVQLASRLGIRSKLMPYPSSALGTNGVSPLDMASAYTSFAADGLHTNPVFVTRVTGADGTVLYNEAPQRERVLPPDIAREVNGILEQVVSRGTGVNARIGRPVAGKTGTGEQWRDAWFVGSTPELTTSVWVGFATSERSMVPPATRDRVTGGTWPAQIWGLFAGAALAETPVSTFPAPSGAAALTVKTQPLPDVSRMPGDRASQLLNDAGYAVRVVEQPNRTYPPGTVLGQEPIANTPITKGTEVTLTLARVPRRTRVPMVLGLLADEASYAVAANGLQVHLVVQAEPPPGSPARAGRVWKQSPLAGEPADEGNEVTVWVNR
ncbi:MAG: penicillin-binding protein family [Actinomycetia bacterium]|nr:penicillin-binding protein family [Actinomycetes bacterium]